MRSRVDQLGVTEPVIQTSGGNQISVGLPAVSDIKQAEQDVGTTARLFFYDWEANALTPSGKPAASLLQAQDPTATLISQGTTATPPGQTGAGSLPLYQAVKLAAAQPYSASKHNARFGSQYFLFGAPGSSRVRDPGQGQALAGQRRRALPAGRAGEREAGDVDRPAPSRT